MKAQSAAFQVLLIVGIMALIVVLPFITAKQDAERNKDLNLNKLSLLHVINSFELFMRSLENTLYVSLVQSVFENSELKKNDGYWYSYDPSREKEIEYPQSDCSNENPNICLLTDDEYSLQIKRTLDDEYIAPIDKSYDAKIKSDNLRNSVFIAYDEVKSISIGRIDSTFETSNIIRYEEINTTLQSNFKKMIFTGYLIVEKIVDISNNWLTIVNRDITQYKPVLVDGILLNGDYTDGNEKFLDNINVFVDKQLIEHVEDFYGTLFCQKNGNDNIYENGKYDCSLSGIYNNDYFGFCNNKIINNPNIRNNMIIKNKVLCNVVSDLLIVSNHLTDKVLPDQVGLIFKYDKNAEMIDLYEYYKDIGTSFEKNAFSLNVTVKDYLQVLDCREHESGTRFKFKPDENLNEFNFDLLCYDKNNNQQNNKIYTCNLTIDGTDSQNKKTHGGFVVDTPFIQNNGEYRKDNIYQCVSSGNSNVFCKLYEDGIKSDSRFEECCTEWEHGSIAPIKDQPSKWYGSQNFCVGDTIKDSNEICDTRKEYQGTTGKGTPGNREGYQFWCDGVGHKSECFAENPNNRYETEGMFRYNRDGYIGVDGLEALCNIDDCGATNNLSDALEGDTGPCLQYSSCLTKTKNLNCSPRPRCPCACGSCSDPKCDVLYGLYCESRKEIHWYENINCVPCPPPAPAGGGA